MTEDEKQKLEKAFYEKLNSLGYTDEQIKSLLELAGEDFFTNEHLIEP